MTLNEQKIADIVSKAETEKRSLNDSELKEIDGFKKLIAEEKADKEAAVKDAVEKRSAASARFEPEEVKGSSAYFRSIAKGNADVGNKEVIADVVRQYIATSPIFAAHENVQKRSTGNSYSYTQVTVGGAGYVKTEGDAGTTDSSSAATMVSQVFKTYSGQKILVTAEAMDDYAADIANEVMTLGLAKSTNAFGLDCVIQLQKAFGGDGLTIGGGDFDPLQTAGSTWTIADILKAYYAIPVRNRTNVKFVCNSAMAATLASLVTLTTQPEAAWIGLTKENIVEDTNVQDNVVFVCNPTLALAIGMKIPVRTVALEVSEGHTFEVQPRFAVGLRDGTAVAAIALEPNFS